jgi:hypothetical protein
VDVRSLRHAVGAAGIAASLALTGCGSDSAGSAETLDRAFSIPVESADVTLDIRARLRGSPELEDPMRLRAQGPYVSGGGSKIPSFDWNVTVDGRGMGFSARAISNGDNAWIEVLGTAYEVGEEAVARANRHVERHHREGGGPGGEVGLDPRRWVVDSREEGDEEVGGVQTTHISGALDVARFLDDVEQAAERSGRPHKGGELTPEERQKIIDAVANPTFDVWVGKDDNVIRRLTAEVSFDVPDADRARAKGVESGEVSLLLELADVGGDQRQRITIPRDARPIDELLDRIGGPGHGMPLLGASTRGA